MTNQNGIRRQNEGDRSTEFKTGRDQLVSDINTFLDTLKIRQVCGNQTKKGLLLLQPRIAETSMGKNGPNTHLLASEYSSGLALYQKAAESGGSYALEMVHVLDDRTEITHVTGTPEISRLLDDALGTDRDQVRVRNEASFGVKDIRDDGSSSYYSYDMYSDGSVKKRYVDLRGMHVTIPVSTVEGIEMAQAAFNQIKDEIL